jgi:hypothetical protein
VRLVALRGARDYQTVSTAEPGGRWHFDTICNQNGRFLLSVARSIATEKLDASVVLTERPSASSCLPQILPRWTLTTYQGAYPNSQSAIENPTSTCSTMRCQHKQQQMPTIVNLDHHYLCNLLTKP